MRIWDLGGVYLGEQLRDWRRTRDEIEGAGTRLEELDANLESWNRYHLGGAKTRLEEFGIGKDKNVQNLIFHDWEPGEALMMRSLDGKVRDSDIAM